MALKPRLNNAYDGNLPTLNKVRRVPINGN